MMKIYKKILLSCLLLFAYGLVHAQVNVTGVVKGSDDGLPIPGVTVSVKDGTAVTATDASGKYKITVAANAVLRFSFIGYNTQTISLKGRTTIDVSLKPSENSLSDVVVVGYHEVQKKTTTAAITVISGKEIENLPAPSFAQALQGKVTGVNIQNFSGQPGARNTFTVRGNSALSANLSEANALSSPLYIIDGVPTSITDLGNFDNTSTDVLAGININDIESIQIAKDAAATAIWGSRGANGVVTIKTKRAAIGKPQVNFNYYAGLSALPRLAQTATGSYERNLKLQFLTSQGGRGVVSGLPQLLTDSLNPAFNNATDWQGLLYRNALIQNADFSIAGASDAINYRFSLNKYNENGVLYGTDLNRYTFRSNISYQINKKLGADINISLSRIDKNPGLGDNPHNINPLSGFNQPSSLYYLSPTDIAHYRGTYNQLRNVDRNDIITGFISLHYQITPDLLFKTEASTNTNINSNQYSSPSTLSAQGIAYAANNASNFVSNNVNNVLSYNKKIAKDNTIGILLFQNFQRDVVNSTYINGNYIPDDHIQVVQGVPQSGLSAFTDYQASALLSYGTQLHYDYKEKYLLDFTWRADGSSRFGRNHKFGYFPAVSAGYVLSDEKFLKPIEWISLLKLRASYGLNGDQPLSFYAPYNGYNLTTGYYNGVAIGTPNYTNGNGVTDPNLTWESTRQFDIGLDASFFHNRVDVTVDYYNKIQDHKYFTFPLSFQTGFTQQTTNSALAVGNSGIEVNISTHNLPPSSKLQWNTNFNFSYNRNKILALPNGNRSFYANYNDYNSGLSANYVFTVGKSIYTFNQMIYAGVYNSQSQVPVNPYTGQLLTYFKGNNPVKPGYPIWRDVNGDFDVWSDEDRGNPQGDLVPSGNPNPSITGGFNNTFSYKNFSLGIGTSFTLKRDIINSYLSNQFNNWTGLNSFAAAGIPDISKLGFWNPALAAQNPNGYKATYPALIPNGPYFYQFFPFSTLFNENGAYFKINYVTFGYKLPKEYLSALKITSCRFYVTVDNVYIFQNSKVPDVEQVNAFGIYDGATYPIPRKLTFGVSVQF